MQIDQAYIAEHDVINRYLLQRLTDDELTAFEIYMLEHPELLNEIEEFSRIKAAVQENRQLLRRKDSRAYIGRALAVAACLLVVVAVVFNPLRQADFPLQDPVLLETFRSTTEAGGITASGEPVVQLQIGVSPLDVINGTQFTVEVIEQAGGDILFSENGLSATEDAWLFFPFTGQSDPLQGNFTVRVTAETEPASVTTYSLQLRQ